MEQDHDSCKFGLEGYLGEDKYHCCKHTEISGLFFEIYKMPDDTVIAVIENPELCSACVYYQKS